jgi:hypothetical protein
MADYDEDPEVDDLEGDEDPEDEDEEEEADDDAAEVELGDQDTDEDDAGEEEGKCCLPNLTTFRCNALLIFHRFPQLEVTMMRMKKRMTQVKRKEMRKRVKWALLHF